MTYQNDPRSRTPRDRDGTPPSYWLLGILAVIVVLGAIFWVTNSNTTNTASNTTPTTTNAPATTGSGAPATPPPARR